MYPFADWLKGSIVHDLVASLILLAVVLLARTILTRMILRQVAQPESRRRWMVNVRNALLLLFVLGLASIWAEELRTFAVSLVAIAAAFVLATKELILCISGSVLRTTGQSFSIGDRIEIGNYRGDVIDHTVLTTTILEIGPGRSFHMHTGRKIVFPNALLMTNPVINESAMEQYVVHVFPIPLNVEEEWKRAEKILLDAAYAECSAFLSQAKQYMEHLEKTHLVSTPSVEPRVAVQIADPKRLDLLVRVPTPVGRQGRIEQAILRRFLEQYYQAAPEQA